MNVLNMVSVTLLSIATSVGVTLLMVRELVPAEEPERTVAAEQDDASVRQLRADVARLQRALDRLSAQIAGSATAFEERVPAEAQPNEEEPATAMADDNPPQARDERLDALFADEHHDPGWQSGRELPARLRQAIPRGSSIVDVECRATLCRVETQHPDPEHYQAFVGAFMPSPERLGEPPLWPGVAEFVTLESSGEHGSLRAVAYLARENHALP